MIFFAFNFNLTLDYTLSFISVCNYAQEKNSKTTAGLVLLISAQYHKDHTNHMIVTITMATNKIFKLKYPQSRPPTQNT